MTTAAMSEDERRAPTVPAPADLPRQLRCCGSVLTEEEWARLPYVGVQDLGDGRPLELRNHGCGSTVSRLAPRRHPVRCEVNTLRGREAQFEYSPCGEPAHWFEDDSPVLYLCEDHARERLLEGATIQADVDGSEVVLDEDGEIIRRCW